LLGQRLDEQTVTLAVGETIVLAQSIRVTVLGVIEGKARLQLDVSTTPFVYIRVALAMTSFRLPLERENSWLRLEYGESLAPRGGGQSIVQTHHLEIGRVLVGGY